jgi:hypothetical protein
MAAIPPLLTSCFQIDPVDIGSPSFNSPVVLVGFNEQGDELVVPSTTDIYELNLHDEPNPVFRVTELFDANGHDEEQIYGRWWIDYEEGTFSSTNIPVIERHDESQHTGTEDAEICPGGGCWWEAQFLVPKSEWQRNGLNQCHQVLAVFSDSDWDDPCEGSQCTEQPTVLARVVWWVWVYDVNTGPPDYESPPPAPSIESCGR